MPRFLSSAPIRDPRPLDPPEAFDDDDRPRRERDEDDEPLQDYDNPMAWGGSNYP